MKPNRMKEKIARGEAALGCSVMFASPLAIFSFMRLGFMVTPQGCAVA